MTATILEEKEISTATTPLNVLIIEHEEHDVDLVLRELKDSGTPVNPTLASNKEEFIKALSNSSFDAVLSDYRLPNWNGLDALRHLRASGQDLPFLLVTGTLGEEAAVECIKQGVNDYVLKDHMSRLPAALRRAIMEKNLRDENVRAHAALRLSEIRNRDLVEHSIYGIFRASDDGKFLDANPAILRILSCDSADDLRTLNLIRDVFRFPEQHGQIMAACRASGQVHGAEAEWRRRDGGLVAVRLHVRTISLPDHESSIEVISEDVTELRAMERQLRQAQKFEAIGQLAGGIAHDFNNVVGAILGWAELGLEQSRSNPQNADRFARIREQADRAAALTRELLAFARRQVLQPKAIDLNAVTSGLVSFLDKVISKDIELRILSSPLDPIKADPTQIEQVLMNLCINARDAMPTGGRLVIETEMVDLDESYCRFYPHVTPGRYAVLSVSDTGVGMDAETRERIFEPFYTTKEPGKGTGMGLATVYGIVKQHTGSIHVYSEPGQGSLFRVYLPAMVASGEAVTDLNPPSAAPAPVKRGSETVLLAEDHESIREMARQTLLGLGYRVLCAADGDEAIRICNSEALDLAILDVVMPKLGGPAVAIKLGQRFPNIPILFTSGYSRDPEAAHTAAPEARFLQKPYSPTTLGRMVREMLDEQAIVKN